MKDTDDTLAVAARALNAAPRASMSEIAAAIGIGRTTLHRRFESREALLRALAEWGLDTWQASLEAVDVNSVVASNDPKRARQAITDLLRGYAAHADVYGPLLTAYEPSDAPEMAARARKIGELETRLISHAQKLGVLRADVPASWIGWTIFGLLVACRDSVRNGDIGHRAVADLFITTFLVGNENK